MRLTNIVTLISIVSLTLLTIHALAIHTAAGELHPLEVVVIEIAWIPLLFSKIPCKRSLILLFAAYSGYFLPRLLELLPSKYFNVLIMPDYIFNNLFFNMLNIPAKMVVSGEFIGIEMKGVGVVGYLVGCSSLRGIPMLIALAITIPARWDRKVIASLIPSLLMFPTNAFRISLILLFSSVFHIDVNLSHILLSPTLTLILVYSLLWLQDRIFKGKLFNMLEESMDCIILIFRNTFPKLLRH